MTIPLDQIREGLVYYSGDHPLSECEQREIISITNGKVFYRIVKKLPHQKQEFGSCSLRHFRYDFATGIVDKDWQFRQSLVAAAPEMYEALKAVISVDNHVKHVSDRDGSYWCIRDEAIEKAKAALSKAEGRDGREGK